MWLSDFWSVLLIVSFNKHMDVFKNIKGIYHPWSWTWNLKFSPWKRRFWTWTPSFFRFHVFHLGECTANDKGPLVTPQITRITNKNIFSTSTLSWQSWQAQTRSSSKSPNWLSFTQASPVVFLLWEKSVKTEVDVDPYYKCLFQLDSSKSLYGKSRLSSQPMNEKLHARGDLASKLRLFGR